MAFETYVASPVHSGIELQMNILTNPKSEEQWLSEPARCKFGGYFRNRHRRLYGGARGSTGPPC